MISKTGAGFSSEYPLFFCQSWFHSAPSASIQSVESIWRWYYWSINLVFLAQWLLYLVNLYVTVLHMIEKTMDPKCYGTMYVQGIHKRMVWFQNLIKSYFSSYMDTTYTVSSGNRPSFSCINPLKPSGTTWFNILKLHILTTECVFVFHMVLTINSEFFPKQD
jgi:hypothetical protein